MAGEGFLGRECPWEPRGRVRATLEMLKTRVRGEEEVQICSNGRTEELCEAVIEAWEKVAPLEARIATLEAALESIANHPSGWPPPEEENSSMRGIAAAALAAQKEEEKP